MVTSQEGVSLKDVHPLGGYEKLQLEMAATEEGFRMTELCLQESNHNIQDVLV